MIKQIKEVFKKPSPLMYASAELAEAKLQKLEAESGMEYAQSMVLYHDTRIRRLEKYLQTLGEQT